MLVPHQNSLNTISVPQLPKILDSSIDLRDLLALHRGNCDVALLFKSLSKRLREVAHLIKRSDAPMEPLENLLGTKCGLFHFFEEIRHLFQRHGF
jgi:hypothetical protein